MKYSLADQPHHTSRAFYCQSRCEKSAEIIDQAGLPKALDAALFHGNSIGGARPKANITDGQTKYIAKFAAQADVYRVVKAEVVAMRLASHAGPNVAPTRLTCAICILPERSGAAHGLVTRSIEGFVLEREVVITTVSGSTAPIEIRRIAQLAARHAWD